VSLRVKLLLAASLLLAVPLAGFRFVLGMESFLREQQLRSASSAAHTLARAIESRADLIGSDQLPADDARLLYVHPLAQAPQVDGYATDWEELALRGPHDGVRAAHHDAQLFLLVVLRDAPPGLRLRLVMSDAPDFARAWLLDAAVPGASVALEVPPGSGAVAPAHADDRLRAGVQHAGADTVFEIRMPLALRARALHFEILGAAGVTRRLPARGTLDVLVPAPELSALVASLLGIEGRRLRVTDARGHVLAQAGTLAADGAGGRFATLLEGLLEPDEDSLMSLAPSTLRLDGPELVAALAGTPATRLRRDEVGGALVVSATRPLRVGTRIVGALVLEESTSAIESLARRALLELAVSAGAAFLLASAVLLTVAARAASRLRALRDQAAHAIDASGRVADGFAAPGGGDEIGDLARSFAAALARLRGYQDYLEQLARRLSHELRTPIAVIRSSLENLSLAADDARGSPPGPALIRALQGADRLDALVRRMSEAARLEQAMADTEKVSVDLRALVASAVAGHAQATAQPMLQSCLDTQAVWLQASPDLVLQALDKLIANARDFAAPGSAITVRLERRGARVRLAVDNRGGPLPAGDRSRLFESMVSEREPAHGSGEPHLGLGLYVVRLVAEFHGGRPFAEDLDGGGARVGMDLPAA
jgi:signal transduction histidine kinase